MDALCKFCLQQWFLQLPYLFWLQEHGKDYKEANSEHVIYFEEKHFILLRADKHGENSEINTGRPYSDSYCQQQHTCR
jgi:hypothetical protein